MNSHSKPSNSFAPSWSWASVKGKISWPENGQWYCYNPDPEPEFIPKLIAVEVEPLRNDPYGQLRKSLLRIEAKVSMAYSLYEGTPSPGSNNQHRTVYSVANQQKIGTIKYDYDSCEECLPPKQVNPVFLMCCLNGKKRSDGTMDTYAIVLQPVLDIAHGVVGTMRRVGLARGIGPEFWRHGAMPMKLVIC